MDEQHQQHLDEQVRGLIAAATFAAAAYRSGPNREVEQLTAMAEDEGSRRDLVRLLVGSLGEKVGQAWEWGWQPADLHRLGRRQLQASEHALLTDAVADQLSGYAVATLDPRWPGQLREAEISVWWRSDQTYLDARTAAGSTWRAVVATALRALHLLTVLPKLELIGPLPGTAVHAPRTRREGAEDVDERILSRVRALLAKAESTTFEAEAETFTAGAQALMARHSIDAALLSATREHRVDGPAARRIGIDNPYESPKSMLLAAVATANRCRTVWARDLGFATVVGHEPDLDAVETLFTSLLVQATSAMTRAGSRTDGRGRSRTRAFRHSFLSAFAARIGERLQEVTRVETDAAAEETGRARGQELVPLLAARSAAVDQAVDDLFPRLQVRSVNLGSDAEGWHSGRTAADQASLGRGGRLEQ
jgi:hypothetical protein